MYPKLTSNCKICQSLTFVSNPCQKINNPKIKNMYTSLNYFLIFIYKLEHDTKEITP